MICFEMFKFCEEILSTVSFWMEPETIFLTCCGFITIIIVYGVTMWLFYPKCCQDTRLLQLYKAVKENNVVEAVAILQHNPGLVNKFKYPEGYTPFMVACANANTQLVRYMLNLGADVSLRSKSGETVLYLTTFYHVMNQDRTNATCLRELYYAGANINEPSKRNFTPLQTAVMFGHYPLTKWLLRKEASTATHPHPVFLARAQGHHEIAALLESIPIFKSITYNNYHTRK